MAKKEQLDDKHSFDVTLKGSIQVGRKLIHPGPRVVLRGDVLAAVLEKNGGAIESYTVQK